MRAPTFRRFLWSTAYFWPSLSLRPLRLFHRGEELAGLPLGAPPLFPIERPRSGKVAAPRTRPYIRARERGSL